MANILNNMKLDLITVKPSLTLKNLLIFSLVGGVTGVSTGDATLIISLIMMYVVIIGSSIFYVGEKNNLDGLYTTLSISRKAVVRGRYLFAAAADIAGGIFAYFISFIVLTVTGKGFDPLENLLAVGAVFIGFSIVQAIQLPIYFKLGYTKAKFVVYIPLVALPAITALISGSVPEAWIGGFTSWLEGNTVTACIIGALLWLLAVSVSMSASRAFYGKREF